MEREERGRLGADAEAFAAFASQGSRPGQEEEAQGAWSTHVEDRQGQAIGGGEQEEAGGDGRYTARAAGQVMLGW